MWFYNFYTKKFISEIKESLNQSQNVAVTVNNSLSESEESEEKDAFSPKSLHPNDKSIP